jgi:hypothetical protein
LIDNIMLGAQTQMLRSKLPMGLLDARVLFRADKYQLPYPQTLKTSLTEDSHQRLQVGLYSKPQDSHLK